MNTVVNDPAAYSYYVVEAAKVKGAKDDTPDIPSLDGADVGVLADKMQDQAEIEIVKTTLQSHPRVINARDPFTHRSLFHAAMAWPDIRQDVIAAVTRAALVPFFYPTPLGLAVRFSLGPKESQYKRGKTVDKAYVSQHNPGESQSPKNAFFPGSWLWNIKGIKNSQEEPVMFDTLLCVKDSNNKTVAVKTLLEEAQELQELLKASRLSWAEREDPLAPAMQLAIAWAYKRLLEGPVSAEDLATTSDPGGFPGWLQTRETPTTKGWPVRSLLWSGNGLYGSPYSDVNDSAGAALNLCLLIIRAPSLKQVRALCVTFA